MLKKFPLFYIALIYTFSAKDKIVFFMNQFALFCSVLTVGIIIAIFSIMNGFEDLIISSIVEKNGHINVQQKKFGENPIEEANSFNVGFEKIPSGFKNIKSIEYIKKQETVVVFNKKNKIPAAVTEDKNLLEPVAVTDYMLYAWGLDKVTGKNDSIDIYDPNTYNALTQNSRHKFYPSFKKFKSPQDYNPAIYLSSAEYKKLFNNDNPTFAKIYLTDENLIAQTIKDLEIHFGPSIELKSWRDVNPYVVSILDLQKKIFVLLYGVFFILLAAIIISINVAFFKEKRKDWALLKILNISPFSVERIFLYKNLTMSKTGHSTINKHKIFSILNLFIFSIYILLNIKQ